MEFRDLSRAVVADVAKCVESVDERAVRALVDALAAGRKVFLVGTGRSGAVLQAMAIRLGHVGVEARVVGSPGCPPVGRGDLVLVGSGSGRTPATLERARAARGAGALVAAVTADPSSPIAEMSAIVVHIPADAAPREGTPHTLRSLFEECLMIVCDCVCRMVQEKLGVSTQDMQSRHSSVE